MAIALLISASFVAWFISMLAGGGSPFILIPLISALFGSQAVAPAITVGLLLGNSQRSLFFWQHINWEVTFWYLPGALLGAILGAFALTRIHLEALQILIAIGLLLMAINYLLNGLEQSFRVEAWYFLPLSFLNAIGSALIGSTGPIMNPVYLNYGMDKETLIATKSFNKVFLHLVKLAAYGALGTLHWQYMGYGLVIGLAAMPANWLGKKVLAHITNQQFHRLVFGFVAISGMLMLWQQRGFLLG